MKPAYLILGPELFLQDQAIITITRDVQKSVGEGLNIERHDAAEFAISDCLQALQHLSMWGTHSLVIVKAVKQWDWSAAAPLIDYLKSPNLSATLVLQGESVDGRNKNVAQLKTLTQLIECKPLYANQLPEWVRGQAKFLDKAMSQEAVNWCLELVGHDLATLQHALEGLALFVGTKSLIDLQDVDGFLAATSQRDVFELTKALGEGRKPQALEILQRLLQYGEAPVFIASMIARHWRILLALRAATTPVETEAAKRQYKLHPFFAPDYIAQAKRWEPRRLMQGLSLLARTDRQLKSSPMSKPLLTELALLRL